MLHRRATKQTFEITKSLLGSRERCLTHIPHRPASAACPSSRSCDASKQTIARVRCQHVVRRKTRCMPGCMASSTSRTFSAADHRRRRCTEVMTSNLGNRATGGRRHSRNHRPTPMPYQLCRVVRSKRGQFSRMAAGYCNMGASWYSGMDYHKHHDRPFSEYCRRRRRVQPKAFTARILRQPSSASSLLVLSAHDCGYHFVSRHLSTVRGGSETTTSEIVDEPSLRFVPLEKAASIRPKC